MAAAGTVGEALTSAADALAAAGVPSPRLDAELLLAAATGLDRARLAADPAAGVEATAARSFGAMVRRRVGREPVAYILGSKGFRRIDLTIDPRVLIPRPESELLVELALELEPATVLDVGTGSGAVALAVADELPGCEVVATDVSRAALALARHNAEWLGLESSVRFGVGTLPEQGGFDLVLANLPYVRSDEWQGLEPEITRFEPRTALVGGADGLEPIRSLIGSIAPPGADGGRLETAAVGLEIDPRQAPEVGTLLERAGFDAVEVRPDLSGRDRVVVARAVRAGGGAKP